MKKGFTLIELVVAVGILAMMLGFTSVIFKVSIKGSRVVGANAEIMQKLRAVTDQLDRDLRGLDKDAPLLIWFEKTSNAQDDPNTRFDQIMFFATGDFQSTQLYTSNLSNNKPVESFSIPDFLRSCIRDFVSTERSFADSEIRSEKEINRAI